VVESKERPDHKERTPSPQNQSAEVEDKEEEECMKYTPPFEFLKQGDVPEEESWSPSHVKLLFLVSKYAVSARSVDDKEGWIRQVALLILLYEGVTSNVLDFDYAPSSELVTAGDRSRR
jgi:hypothetical protein